MFKLFIEEDGDVSVLLNHIQQNDMELTLTYDGVSLITDGLPYAKSPHPRLYGSFPRFLRHFVREKHLLTWEQAIFKMTGQPAKRFCLEDRGEIKEGYHADVTIFNPKTVTDRATYASPTLSAEGIDYVIVNGEVVLHHQERTGCHPGTFISKGKKGG